MLLQLSEEEHGVAAVAGRQRRTIKQNERSPKKARVKEVQKVEPRKHRTKQTDFGTFDESTVEPMCMAKR